MNGVWVFLKRIGKSKTFPISYWPASQELIHVRSSEGINSPRILKLHYQVSISDIQLIEIWSVYGSTGWNLQFPSTFWALNIMWCNMPWSQVHKFPYKILDCVGRKILQTWFMSICISQLHIRSQNPTRPSNKRNSPTAYVPPPPRKRRRRTRSKQNCIHIMHLLLSLPFYVHCAPK